MFYQTVYDEVGVFRLPEHPPLVFSTSQTTSRSDIVTMFHFQRAWKAIGSDPRLLYGGTNGLDVDAWTV